MCKQLVLIAAIVFHPICDACCAGDRTWLPADSAGTHLDGDIIQHLAKYGQYIPLIDLGFAIGELCQAFKENPLLSDELIKNIKERRRGSTKDDAAYWETEDRFFATQLRHNEEISRECAKEMAEFQHQSQIRKSNDLLKDDEISKEIEEASELPGISEASTGVFNMLVFDAERVIRIVQDYKELTLKYKRWLSKLQEAGIYSPWTHGKMLERKKAYILEKYGKSSNELMKETLSSIRITPVKYID